MTLDRAHYVEQCELRWSDEPLRGAKRDWHHWLKLHDDLENQMRRYKRDPQMHGYNPDGTLTSFLWKLQDAWQQDKSCLYPLLDFCDHYQRIFLRRGLVIYCTMILKALEVGEPTDLAQLALPLTPKPAPSGKRG